MSDDVVLKKLDQIEGKICTIEVKVGGIEKDIADIKLKMVTKDDLGAQFDGLLEVVVTKEELNEKFKELLGVVATKYEVQKISEKMVTKNEFGSFKNTAYEKLDWIMGKIGTIDQERIVQGKWVASVDKTLSRMKRKVIRPRA